MALETRSCYAFSFPVPPHVRVHSVEGPRRRCHRGQWSSTIKRKIPAMGNRVVGRNEWQHLVQIQRRFLLANCLVRSRPSTAIETLNRDKTYGGRGSLRACSSSRGVRRGGHPGMINQGNGERRGDVLALM